MPPRPLTPLPCIDLLLSPLRDLNYLEKKIPRCSFLLHFYQTSTAVSSPFLWRTNTQVLILEETNLHTDQVLLCVSAHYHTFSLLFATTKNNSLCLFGNYYTHNTFSNTNATFDTPPWSSQLRPLPRQSWVLLILLHSQSWTWHSSKSNTKMSLFTAKLQCSFLSSFCFALCFLSAWFY